MGPSPDEHWRFNGKVGDQHVSPDDLRKSSDTASNQRLSLDDQWRSTNTAKDQRAETWDATRNDPGMQFGAFPAPPAVDPAEKRREHQAAIRQAVDAMDDFVQG